MELKSRTDIRRSLETKSDLPVLSSVVGKILELTRDEDVWFEKVADVIKKDVALATKILRVVNSPFYGYGGKISTVSQAISILGLNTVKNLCLSLSIVNAFPTKKGDFDYRNFWKRTFYSATAARLIANHTPYKDKEEVFIGGLLHDLGILLLGTYYPEEYKKVAEGPVDGDEGETVKEREIFNIDHTEVGEILASRWNLPEKLGNAIRYHHSPDLWGVISGDQKPLLQSLYLADLLTQVFSENAEKSRAITRFKEEAKRLLSITEEEAEEILEKSDEETRKTIQYFEFDIPSEKTYTEILLEANQELAKINQSLEEIQALERSRSVPEEKVEEDRQIEILTCETEDDGSFAGLVGNSVEMLKVFSTIKQVSKYTSTVLINGNTGTGKELVASAIHKMSPRAEGKYLAFNVASIPPTLLESELFGHEKGAFTGANERKIGLFEAAEDGTVFLDEIGELAINLQAALLRVLENREVRRVGSTKNIPINVRIITATNRDLEKEIKSNRFREDLYYRLNVVTIKLPRLVDRKEDILLLCDHYLKKFNAKFNKNVTIPSPILDILLKYSWEGNIRELVNVIESAVLMASGESMVLENLPQRIREFAKSGNIQLAKEGFETLEEVEKLHICRILKMLNGNKVQASKVLGLGRSSLYRKIVKYDLKEFL